MKKREEMQTVIVVEFMRAYQNQPHERLLETPSVSEEKKKQNLL
jgi:hypothetical protein